MPALDIHSTSQRLKQILPGASRTDTSFQKRFFIALPGFIWLARRSCPLRSSSACRRRLSTRCPFWDDAGNGGCGGGPAVVVGSGMAGLEGVVCKDLNNGVWIRNEPQKDVCEKTELDG